MVHRHRRCPIGASGGLTLDAAMPASRGITKRCALRGDADEAGIACYEKRRGFAATLCAQSTPRAAHYYSDPEITRMSFNVSGRLIGAVIMLTACVAGPK